MNNRNKKFMQHYYFYRYINHLIYIHFECNKLKYLMIPAKF